MILWAPVKGPCKEGRPIKKNAMAKLSTSMIVSTEDQGEKTKSGSTHNNQGKARTQTDGLILNRTYQQMDATKKMAPIMYKSTLVEELLPVNSVNWKEVCRRERTSEMGLRRLSKARIDSQRRAIDRAR
jgi:hypothetical protein